MPRCRWISWSVALVLAIIGIFWITLAFLPYGMLKPFIGSLMPDGNFNSLKPWNALTFKILFGLGGTCISLPGSLDRYEKVEPGLGISLNGYGWMQGNS